MVKNNLKHLSQKELLEGAKQLVSQELEISLQLLEYLREIEGQMVFAELGFDSMWSFCVNYLGLSEGDAQRKLATMRLCKAIPEVKEDISQGRITLTNAAKVQSFFTAEKRAGKDLSLDQKKEVLQSVQNLSKTECEKKLIELSPTSAVPAERVRCITQEHSELKVILDSKTLEALDQLKNLLAHTFGNASYQSLIQYLATETLKRVRKSKGLDVATPVMHETPSSPPPVAAPIPDRHPVGPRQQQRQAVPANLRRLVFQRANGKCEYQSPDGKKCESQHRLEINHKTPVAWGGTNNIFNMELTCRTHNVLHAQQKLGRDQMARFGG